MFCAVNDGVGNAHRLPVPVNSTPIAIGLVPVSATELAFALPPSTTWHPVVGGSAATAGYQPTVRTDPVQAMTTELATTLIGALSDER